jgi:hypothetical protein
MPRNDPLSVIRSYFVVSNGAKASPGLRAVEVECALQRAGMTIVSSEVAAVFAAIVSHGCVSGFQLQVLLIQLGLAKIVPFDPEKHDPAGAEIAKGADFLEYSQSLIDVMRFAKPHLRGPMN